MIVKFIGIFILALAIQRILKEVGFSEDKIESRKKSKKLKEKFINSELKDRGVGTFGSLQFTYDKEKRKEKNLYDISHLKPEEIKKLIEINKGERENIFNEYKALRNKKNRTDYEEKEYTNLGNHLKNLDTYIGKIERIHAKVLVDKETNKDYKESKLKYKPINPDEKLTTAQEEKIYKFPSGNLLDISEDRNILETRIQSFDTDIKIVNKKRIIHELDNKIFNDELKKGQSGGMTINEQKSSEMKDYTSDDKEQFTAIIESLSIENTNGQIINILKTNNLENNIINNNINSKQKIQEKQIKHTEKLKNIKKAYEDGLQENIEDFKNICEALKKLVETVNTKTTELKEKIDKINRNVNASKKERDNEIKAIKDKIENNLSNNTKYLNKKILFIFT